MASLQTPPILTRRSSLKRLTKKASISWSLKAQFRTAPMVQAATLLLGTRLSRRPLERLQRTLQLLLQSEPVPPGVELPMQPVTLKRIRTTEELLLKRLILQKACLKNLASTNP